MPVKFEDQGRGSSCLTPVIEACHDGNRILVSILFPKNNYGRTELVEKNSRDEEARRSLISIAHGCAYVASRGTTSF